MIDSWLDEMKFNLDKVLEACTRASFISSPNLRYVNRVLLNWFEEARISGRNVNSSAGVTQAVLSKYYAYLREKAEEEAQARRAEVYKKIPRIREVDEDLLELGQNISRAVLSGDSLKLNEMKRLMKLLEEERAVLLTENNYREDYTDVKYACDKCGDTGMTEDGNRCSCTKERMGEAELWQSSTSSKKIKKRKKSPILKAIMNFLRKNSEKKEKISVFSVIWDKAADAVEAVDEILEELEEIWEAGSNGLVNIGAAVINFYDKASAVVEWFILKTLVVFGRRLHDIRVKSIEYKNDIIKNSIILGSAFIVIAIAFALTTGYEYSYNGRPLGIVKEQKDVVEILELASEELSQEYGSNIVIDPEEDITFRTVVSYGKESRY